MIIGPAVRVARADRSDVGKYFTGGHIGVGVTAGPHLLADTSWDGALGWTAGAHARLATVMQVIDLQLEYAFATHGLRVDGAAVDMRRHSLSSSINLHPLFLRVLGNNRFNYTLAGWYVQTGGSVEFTSLEGPALGVDRDDVAFSLHAGTGIDTPLDDPNIGGGGFWLGISWRWKWVFMNPGLGDHEDLDSHLFLVVLSYRRNNLSFARVPRPPELKYR